MADVNPLDHLAAEKDLSSEQVRGIVDRLEEELDQPIACRGCNEISDPPHVTPLAYPRPWADGEDRLLCQTCWAGEVAKQTDLTERQAEILALKLAGFSNDEIGTAIGRAAGTVSSTLSRLKSRDETIDEEIHELEQTGDILETVIWRG